MTGWSIEWNAHKKWASPIVSAQRRRNPQSFPNVNSAGKNWMHMAFYLMRLSLFRLLAAFIVQTAYAVAFGLPLNELPVTVQNLLDTTRWIETEIATVITCSRSSQQGIPLLSSFQVQGYALRSTLYRLTARTVHTVRLVLGGMNL